MNQRVLELLKTPKNIQSEDLSLLREEIDSFPYIQNIRALYLYGVHRYDKENYQKVLSTTAAYTTDKKILYQLINGKIQQRPKPEIPSEATIDKPVSEEKLIKPLKQVKISGFPLKREDAPVNQSAPEVAEPPEEKTVEDKEQPRILPEPKPEIKQIYVNGEKNRILFEGEENFLEDEDVETIDLESTLESGSIVTQKPEKPQVPVTENKSQIEEKNQQVQDPINESSEEFTPETIIEEEKITSEPEKEEVLNKPELNFHETERFVPETQIQNNNTAEEIHKPDTADDPIEDTDRTQQTVFTSETVINENEISLEKEKESVQDGSELSFHGMESFLPEVKIQGNSTEENGTPEIPRSDRNKHEDEMRRLIEEVEKKMKEKAAASDTIKKEKEAEPEDISHDISFAETQNFEIQPSEPEIKDELTKEDNISVKETEPEIIEELKEEDVAEEETAPAEVKSAWKPMSLESNLPDSLLSKPAETPQLKAETPEAEIAPEKVKAEEEKPVQKEILPLADKPAKTEAVSEEPDRSRRDNQINEDEVREMESKEEVPVMNVSFFGSGWSIAQPEKNEHGAKEGNNKVQEQKTQEAPATTATPNPADSNIPGFINTWQNWLKIDRTEEVEKEKVEVKAKVIEAFIEKNPRISQLKDEVNFVVKEKGDDISHLMTETLANLYIEQKLYTKAVKAFEILIGKMPEKEAYFKGRIQEIKDLRNK